VREIRRERFQPVADRSYIYIRVRYCPEPGFCIMTRSPTPIS
jgi:hypothetical protein